jgi:general secretion pathway protein K
MQKPGNPTTRNEDGFALVIVIVIMLLATFLASQLILQVRTELQVAYNFKQRNSGVFLAEGGINFGLFRLMDKPVNLEAEEEEEFANFLHGRPYDTMLPDGKITYYAVNESGKIDLNSLPRGLLELFLEYHGAEPEQIEVILDSLEDWVDRDNLHRLNGAENDFYEELSTPYTAHDDKIIHPAEFFLVQGTDILRNKFIPEEVFTVYNTTRKINFNSLTPAMLDFLTEGNQEKIQLYYENQALFIRLNTNHALEILGDERFSLLRPFLSFSSGKNPYYFIVSKGEKGYDSGDENQESRHVAGMTVSVLAEIRGTRYTYLSWKERHT